MSSDDDLLRLVPIGEENAVTARSIWKELGVWSQATIKGRLNVLAAAGRIQHKKASQAAEASLYFRRIEGPQSPGTGLF